MYIGCSFENFSHLLQMFYPVDQYSVNGRGKYTLGNLRKTFYVGVLSKLIILYWPHILCVTTNVSS